MEKYAVLVTVMPYAVRMVDDLIAGLYDEQRRLRPDLFAHRKAGEGANPVVCVTHGATSAEVDPSQGAAFEKPERIMGLSPGPRRIVLRVIKARHRRGGARSDTGGST